MLHIQKQKTPFLTTLGLLFFLWISKQNKNKINFLDDHPMKIPTSFASAGPVVSEKIKM